MKERTKYYSQVKPTTNIESRVQAVRDTAGRVAFRTFGVLRHRGLI